MSCRPERHSGHGFITVRVLSAPSPPVLHAKGIVLRDELPGALIKIKSQQVCRSGEFLVAEIDAKVGGFGIVPDGYPKQLTTLFVVTGAR